MRRDVFQTIADPTRRKILNRAAHQPLNVNTVSGNFDISRAAIYKHIKILSEYGLIIVRQKGLERFCEARLEKLSQVSDWVEQYRKPWTNRLDSPEGLLNQIQPLTKTHDQKRRTGKS